MKLMGNLAPVSELGPRRAQSAQTGKAQHLSSPSVQRGWREESPVRWDWRNLLDWGEDASGKCEGKSKDRMRIMNERWKTSRSPKWRRKGYSGIYGSQLGRMNNCFHCQDKAQGSLWQFPAQLYYILHIPWMLCPCQSSICSVRLMLKDPKNPGTALAHGCHSRIL